MESVDKKFGVFVDSFYIKKWQFDCIEKVLTTTSYKLSLVVCNKTKPKTNFRISHLFFFAFKKIFVRLNILKSKDIRELASDFVTLDVDVEKKGKFSEYFNTHDIDNIKSYKLDFILRFGFGIIRGEVLNSAKYGVWSFHHGDEQKYRGGPYCFWEIYYNEPITCAILQRLTNKLDGGIVLKKGYFKTSSDSFSKNIEQCLSLTTEWPSQLCKEIENNNFKFPVLDAQTNSKIFLLPSNLKMIYFIFKILKNKIKNSYNRYLTFDFWHVGYINKSMYEVLNSEIVESEINWLKLSSANCFYADPFVFEKEGKTILTCEYLPYKGFKGQINAFSGKELNVPEPDFDIKEDYHLSYPNTFQDNGTTYCLPEGYEADNLYIYEKRHKGWEKHLIIKNIKCIDPELIFHDGNYYIFTTIKGCNHETKLFIYYSENILSGWREHLLNPVIFDVRSARGAGKIFKLGNDLFRPGQNYSIHKEGSITISKINKLSPFEYSEEIVSNIHPIKNSKYPDKIHTLNSLKNITVIDACEIRSLIFRPDIFLRIVKSKL